MMATSVRPAISRIRVNRSFKMLSMPHITAFQTGFRGGVDIVSREKLDDDSGSGRKVKSRSSRVAFTVMVYEFKDGHFSDKAATIGRGALPRPLVVALCASRVIGIIFFLLVASSAGAQMQVLT